MESYDYIVVGAGSAGAAVANRLSSDPRNKVLLLEAGRASHPWSPIPIGMARLIANPAANWLYSSEPEANTNGRRIPVPRGKLLGGSSSINGMVFVRGQAQDFDTWAQMGNRGWSYAEVLPFFKRMESYAGEGDNAFRGREGPLRVTNPEPRDPLFATIIKAAAEDREDRLALHEVLDLLAQPQRMDVAAGALPRQKCSPTLSCCLI
jgi:choline dehydrogenase